jgi:tRNA(Ile)-lysidine synthase
VALAMESAPWPAAVAVSGGSDSLALMHLIARWARSGKRPAPVVLTVDHGLQRGSAEQARAVLREARAAGLAAHLLSWKGPKPRSNIEALAREARYRLMAEWCRKHAVPALVVGHTRDDQIETFLLRLGRGSGVDGLSAMAPRTHVSGFADVALLRPLLRLERAALRTWLADNGIGWRDDPMNGEERFARVRVRSLVPALEAAGIAKARIAAAASHLARARAALEVSTDAFLDEASAPVDDGMALEAGALATVPREIGLRALAQLLTRVSGAAYRPRFERLERLFDALAEFRKGRTLHGCRITPAPKAVAIFGPSTVLIVPERRGKPPARSLRSEGRR